MGEKDWRKGLGNVNQRVLSHSLMASKFLNSVSLLVDESAFIEFMHLCLYIL